LVSAVFVSKDLQHSSIWLEPWRRFRHLESAERVNKQRIEKFFEKVRQALVIKGKRRCAWIGVQGEYDTYDFRLR